ncbi:MAG: hypothetical protein HYW48_01850 [Deltaproteobacteria bacterium]|nr:hypothetical protein [Deltaproteobacteria bacterium]
MKFLDRKLVIGLSVFYSLNVTAIVAPSVKGDLSKPSLDETIWATAKEETVTLMAQPMAIPRPAETATAQVKVKAVHNDSWIAFRLSWEDKEKSEAGKLGEFSDAVAVQFPVKDNKSPPPVFMGMKDNPVHIFHWRAQYQIDKEKGKREMKDIYPNMNPDMYPMEFKDEGHLTGLTDEKREIFSHGRAAGNPQSYAKAGVDEIFAEGFGTSSVIKNVEAVAHGEWQKSGWTVVISRPLVREEGSHLKVGEDTFVGFAVWQGGKDEVGSRKSVTMQWTPLSIAK